MKRIILFSILFILVLGGSLYATSSLIFVDVKATSADIELYVNANTGSDSNNGTIGSPYKTVGKAVYKLPQILNHNVSIYVSAGTYNEDILISGYTGKGVFRLIGASNLDHADEYIVNRIHYRYNTVPVYIIGFTATTNTDVGILAGYNSGYSEIKYSRVVTASTDARGIANYYSPFLMIYGCEISNRHLAIYTSGGKTWSVDQSGTGNAYGLFAEKLGTIGKAGTQPTATNSEVFASGGTVVWAQ
jgi:hypothetical protein